MSNTISSPNMGLPVPVVLTDPGPDYAVNVNTSLNTIDSHDHTTGKGVPVSVAGLNINADLNFQGNNATNLRSTRFVAQSSPLSLSSDVGAAYVSGVDLYFNDGSGNQIRMTQSGSIAGTAGSITNLVAPASASYSTLTQTFVFQSGVSIPANIDAAAYIFRNLNSNGFGVTVSPPNLASNYNLTLPIVPNTLSFLGIDTSGNIQSVASVSQGITRNYLAPVGLQTSSFINWVGTSNSAATIATISITTTGRPVMLMLMGVAQNSGIILFNSGSTTSGIVKIIIGSSTTISGATYSFNNFAGVYNTVGTASAPNSTTILVPGSISVRGATAASLSYIDTPAAGTYTYSVQAGLFNPFVAGSNETIQVSACIFKAYEL